MRKLTGAAFVSLDGVIQAPGGPTEDPTGGFDRGGWVFAIGDEGINDTLGQLFTPPYALLLGRRTYDIFAAYWPYADGENAGMGEALTAADKHVVTHGEQPSPLPPRRAPGPPARAGAGAPRAPRARRPTAPTC